MFLFTIICLLFTAAYGADTQCPIVPTTAADRRPSPNTLRLVQYNTEWLFIDYYAQADCPGAKCPWKNQTEAQTHLQYVAKVIDILQPDIINICEVEGCDELQLLVNELPSAKTYSPFLIKGADTSTGQNVGLISRIDPKVNLYRTEERVAYPVPGSKCGYTGSGTATSGVSKHYISEFSISGLNIAFIGAHLLAYPTDVERCAEREAQAQVLQNVIMGYRNKNYEIMVMGDFNDFDAEIMDSNNDRPISMVLGIMKGLAGQYSGKYELHNVAEKIPQAGRFSDWWDQNGNCVSTSNEFSMIDHVLVSKNLLDKVKNVFIYQDYTEFCGTYNSDHYPVVVDFAL
jgi:exonuclease III